MDDLVVQYIAFAGEFHKSDFNSMLYWMEIKSVVSEVSDSAIVQAWFDFKAGLVNFRGSEIDRSFLEKAALSKCDSEDYYELNDSIDSLPDHELITIAQLF